MKRYLTILMVVWLTLTMSVCSLAAPFDRYSIDDEKETMKTIAAGGFKDITRIASSSPVMWESICMTNKDSILQLMDLYMESLQNLRKDRPFLTYI